MTEEEKTAIDIRTAFLDQCRGTTNSKELISRLFRLQGQTPVAEILKTYQSTSYSAWNTDFYIPSSWC